MLSTFAKRTAAGGVVVWLVTLPLTTSDSELAELIHKVVFFAVLVVVPLGLSMVGPAEQKGLSLYKLAVSAQPVAGLLTVASFYLDHRSTTRQVLACLYAGAPQTLSAKVVNFTQ
jgi:hypothetical protein